MIGKYLIIPPLCHSLSVTSGDLVILNKVILHKLLALLNVPANVSVV